MTPPPHYGITNRELRQQYPLHNNPTLEGVKKFNYGPNLYQHQKHHLPHNRTYPPPNEKIKGNQTHIQIPERSVPQKELGRHPNLPWASQLLAPPWPPPCLPQVPQHPPPRLCSKRQNTHALATEAAYKLPRQTNNFPTRPPVVSLTELVASIGQNSHIAPQEQVHIDPARSQEPLQCYTPMRRSILDSNVPRVHNSTRGGHIIEPKPTNTYDTINANKLRTLAPPSHSNEISTLPSTANGPIMPNKSRPITQQKHPTQDNTTLKQISMNDMSHISHHEHAIRVEDNTQYLVNTRVTKQKAPKEKDMDQKQTKIRQLEKLRQEQEAIKKMFHNARFKHLLDPRIYRPYNTKPEYIASFATRSKKPTFQCLACNYKTRGKTHFEGHHKSTMHAFMLSKWSLKQLQQRFPNHVLQIDEEPLLDTENHNIEVPDHDFYTTRRDRPTKRPSAEEQRKNLQKIQAIHNDEPNLEFSCSSQTTTPLAETNLPDDDLDTLPIQWHPKQPIPGTTIEELNQIHTYNAAMASINKLIPAQYRQKLTELVSIMFNAGKTYSLEVTISESLLNNDHWFIFKYERLMKRIDLQQYLIRKASNKDYNVVKKDKAQDQEMEKIAGAARIVYDIILNCKIIPIQYTCILAIFMDKGEHPNFICSSMRTTTGQYIDLFLESGIFTLTKKNIPQESPTRNDLTCSIEEQFSRIVMEDQTDTTQEVNPPTDNFNEYNPQPVTPIIDAEGNVNPIYPFDQQEIQLSITLQENYNLLSQQSEQQQQPTSQEEQSIQIIEDHGFTIQSDTESIDPPEDNPSTTLPPYFNYSAIFIYGLTHYNLDHELTKAFKEFGEIKKIYRPSRRSAVLTYRNSTQATKAIEMMNGRVFMKEILSVSISQPNRKKKARKKEIKSNDKTDNNTTL